MDLGKRVGAYERVYGWFGYDEGSYSTAAKGRALLAEFSTASEAYRNFVFIACAVFLQRGNKILLHDQRNARPTPVDSGVFYSSTQSKLRVTAFFHCLYRCSCRGASICGFHLWSISQLSARCSTSL